MKKIFLALLVVFQLNYSMQNQNQKSSYSLINAIKFLYRKPRQQRLMEWANKGSGENVGYFEIKK